MTTPELRAPVGATPTGSTERLTGERERTVERELREARRATPTLAERYDAVRAQTEALCEPLEIEDYVVSTMTDVSPTKWHLAHTSWFFETFVLAPSDPSYASPNPKYAFLFNSYYVQAGASQATPSTRRCR
jgi:hypothetical protein